VVGILSEVVKTWSALLALTGDLVHTRPAPDGSGQQRDNRMRKVDHPEMARIRCGTRLRPCRPAYSQIG